MKVEVITPGRELSKLLELPAGTFFRRLDKYDCPRDVLYMVLQAAEDHGRLPVLHVEDSTIVYLIRDLMVQRLYQAEPVKLTEEPAR